MAKPQTRGGRYRQMLLAQQGEEPARQEPVSFFRVRFYICICLFIGYLILDYTKASVGSVDSSRIYAEIHKDLAAEVDLEAVLAKAVNSIHISESEK